MSLSLRGRFWSDFRRGLLVLVGGLLSMVFQSHASAGGYAFPGPGVIGVPGVVLPAPKVVPGKEFTHHLDYDDTEAPLLDPEQVLAWDGLGGTVVTDDHTLQRAGSGDTIDRQLDAIANQQDHLFLALFDGTVDAPIFPDTRTVKLPERNPIRSSINETKPQALKLPA